MHAAVLVVAPLLEQADVATPGMMKLCCCYNWEEPSLLLL
jgi:hypothetical protein